MAGRPWEGGLGRGAGADDGCLESNAGIVRRLVRVAGGPDQPRVHAGAAGEHPAEGNPAGAFVFERRGIDHRQRAGAEVLRAAAAVWGGGGAETGGEAGADGAGGTGGGAGGAGASGAVPGGDWGALHFEAALGEETRGDRGVEAGGGEAVLGEP